METPNIPLSKRYTSLAYSLITVLWWIGIWGLTETVVGFLVKESLLLRLGIFLSMIALVFFLILIRPELVEYL
jgi:low temperature requirement protein LtrA